MKRGLRSASGLALAIWTLVFALGAATPTLAQMGQTGGAPQCAQFTSLNATTQVKANAVQAAMKAKSDRKEICRLMTAFVGSEGSVVKFLIDNKTWCGVPDQVVDAAKTAHEKSLKFRDVVCTEAPAVRAPSLSDAIKTSPVDSSSNTKTDHGGTFDTLTGNPLGR